MKWGRHYRAESSKTSITNYSWKQAKRVNRFVYDCTSVVFRYLWGRFCIFHYFDFYYLLIYLLPSPYQSFVHFSNMKQIWFGLIWTTWFVLELMRQINSVFKLGLCYDIMWCSVEPSTKRKFNFRLSDMIASSSVYTIITYIIIYNMYKSF